MKKIVSLILCLLVLCLAATAVADYKPGDTVTVTVRVTGGTAAMGRVRVSASADVFEFVSANLQGAVGGSAPGGLNQSFALYSADLMSPISGTVGVLVLKIKSGAAPGSYPISLSTSQTFDGDNNVADMQVSGGMTVVIAKPECNHTWGEGVVTTAATCEGKGVKTFTCGLCGDTKTEEIPATGHAYNNGAVTTPATCVNPGVMTFTCGNDGSHTYTEPIAATGEHTWDSGVDSKPATCTDPGTKLFTCSVCGATDTTEIPAKNHAWDAGKVTTEATCVAPGVMTFTCGNDGAHTRTEEIPATGKHTPSADAVRVEPTCEAEGSITYNCSVCGTKISGETIPAKGHAWDAGKVTTPATCTADGVTTFTCGNDASHTKTEKIPMLNHAWDAGKVTTPATCTVDGVTTFTCGNDGSHTRTEAIPMLNHAWDAGKVTTEPTCTADGVKTFTCTHDATHTRTEKVDKLGHAWGEWVTTKPVVEKEDGEEQRTCTRCGEVETRVIKARQTYYMTACASGIRFRDLENPLTDKWYMFTPLDLSVDGETVYDLVAGDIHVIGTVTVTVKEGFVTVTYELFNAHTVTVYEEFMTLVPALSALTELDYEKMTGYAYGEPISIQETLGGDTKVLLLMRNLAMYDEGVRGVEMFQRNSESYDVYVEQLKLLMD